MRRTNAIVGFSGLLLCAACATTAPPTELVDARQAYQRAQVGPAVQYSPADLHTAELALQDAERSFEEDGDSNNTKDLAYIAQRKAELAEVKAATVVSEAKRSQAQAKVQSETQTALKKTRQELETATEARKHAEQRAVEAEKRAKEAMDRLRENLSRVATIKEETRGTVITLSGSVLFASGESVLLPDAQNKLSEVAEALKESQSTIVVEGHTDSRGREDTNQALSFSRAQAVVSYLVSRGIEPTRVSAVGHGSSRPVADNAKAEGRANNRRVEIIVQPDKEPK